MVQERHEVGNGLLKIDVIFPKGIISINEQDLRTRLGAGHHGS
jgi:hypothetical protein